MDEIVSLALYLPSTGTNLDRRWNQLFQYFTRLIISANNNSRHLYVIFSAKIIQLASEIVRSIEMKEIQSECIFETEVKIQIREISKSILIDFPKKILIATRVSIGIW